MKEEHVYPADAPGDAHFHLFVYGTLRTGGESNHRLEECEFVRTAAVDGTLYDIDGQHPVLMLYGGTRIEGEIWRCPAGQLVPLDAFEGVDRGLFRRVGVLVDGTPCWTYVAGPAFAHKLTPDRRIPSGRWPAAMHG